MAQLIMLHISNVCYIIAQRIMLDIKQRLMLHISPTYNITYIAQRIMLHISHNVCYIHGTTYNVTYIAQRLLHYRTTYNVRHRTTSNVTYIAQRIMLDIAPRLMLHISHNV
jgi:hypothetical protein